MALLTKFADWPEATQITLLIGITVVVCVFLICVWFGPNGKD